MTVTYVPGTKQRAKRFKHNERLTLRNWNDGRRRKERRSVSLNQCSPVAWNRRSSGVTGVSLLTQRGLIVKRPEFYRGEHDDFIRKLYEEEPVDQRGDFALCLEEEFGLTAAQAKEALKYFQVPAGTRIAHLYAEELADAENSGVRYYEMGTVMSGGNVARVKGHEYAYLDHKTGAWVRDARVCDAVTGYYGDADTFEIPLGRAQTLASIFAPNVEVEWLDVSGDGE
jgi:hypothetical protein